MVKTIEFLMYFHLISIVYVSSFMFFDVSFAPHSERLTGQLTSARRDVGQLSPILFHFALVFLLTFNRP